MILSKHLVHKLLKLIGVISLFLLYIFDFLFLMNSCGGRVAETIYVLITNIVVLFLYLINMKRYKYLLITYSMAYIASIIELISKINFNNIPSVILFLIPLIWMIDVIITIFKGQSEK